MISGHYISATPAGTIRDFFKGIFQGRGERAELNGRPYTLREEGDLEKDSLIRANMLRQIISWAKENPNRSYFFRTRLA